MNFKVMKISLPFHQIMKNVQNFLSIMLNSKLKTSWLNHGQNKILNYIHIGRVHSPYLKSHIYLSQDYSFVHHPKRPK